MATTTSILNNLIETSKDGEQGFLTSADNAKDPELKALFRSRAEDCARGASELQALVAGMGDRARKQRQRRGRPASRLGQHQGLGDRRRRRRDPRGSRARRRRREGELSQGARQWRPVPGCARDRAKAVRRRVAQSRPGPRLARPLSQQHALTLAGSFPATLWRELSEDNVWNGAAALGFYLTLAVFPAMIFVMALVPYLPIAQRRPGDHGPPAPGATSAHGADVLRRRPGDRRRAPRRHPHVRHRRRPVGVVERHVRDHAADERGVRRRGAPRLPATRGRPPSPSACCSSCSSSARSRSWCWAA